MYDYACRYCEDWEAGGSLAYITRLVWVGNTAWHIYGYIYHGLSSAYSFILGFRSGYRGR